MQIIPITTLVPLLIFYLQSFSVNSSHALSKSISIPAMGGNSSRINLLEGSVRINPRDGGQ